MDSNDERLKAAIRNASAKKGEATGMNYLYEPQGAELHWDGLKEKQEPMERQASLAGPAPRYSSAPAKEAVVAVAKPMPKGIGGSQTRRLSPEEMQAAADAMLAVTEARTADANKAGGAAVGDLDESGKRLPDWLKRESER